MPKAKNHHLDKFAIAYLGWGDEEHWLETHHTEGRAEYYCGVVNDHEKVNGRPEKYYVTRID